LGKKIVHRRVKPGQSRPAWEAFHLPIEVQKMLEEIELAIADGREENYFKGDKDRIVGKLTVREFVEKNKALWLQSNA
jgi:hypothetical protein